jgi:predicted PurR-regulated permease PerM
MKKIKIENRQFFIALTAAVLLLSFITLRPVLSLAIMAFLVVNLFNPVYESLRKVLRSTKLASGISVIIVLLCVVLPTVFIAITSFNQIKIFVNDIEEFTGEDLLPSTAEELEEEESSSLEGIITNTGNSSDSVGSLNVQDALDTINTNIQKISFLEDTEITLQQTRDAIAELAFPVSTFVANNLVDFATSLPLIVTYVILFITLVATLFPSQARVKSLIIKFSPLENEIDEIYIKKVLAMANSMIRGTFVIAIVQGLLSGLILWIVGVEYAYFWTLLSIFFSIIPVGPGVVNIPIAIVLMLSGNMFAGLVILISNVLLVGTVDNLLRPALVSTDAKLPSALILLGVIGGLQTFGIFGFIYGPIVMILLVTTFDIYVNYYKEDKTA